MSVLQDLLHVFEKVDRNRDMVVNRMVREVAGGDKEGFDCPGTSPGLQAPV